jgi:putative methionine-R-sulfoxide reductase with GAF domain
MEGMVRWAIGMKQYMKKWVGLKNYAKEKLIMAAFVGDAVSGPNFVAVKTVIAAMLLSPVYV